MPLPALYRLLILILLAGSQLRGSILSIRGANCFNFCGSSCCGGSKTKVDKDDEVYGKSDNNSGGSQPANQAGSTAKPAGEAAEGSIAEAAEDGSATPTPTSGRGSTPSTPTSEGGSAPENEGGSTPNSNPSYDKDSIKLFSKDPTGGNNSVEMGTNDYESIECNTATLYKIKDGKECVEVKCLNDKVWSSGSNSADGPLQSVVLRGNGKIELHFKNKDVKYIKTGNKWEVNTGGSNPSTPAS